MPDSNEPQADTGALHRRRWLLLGIATVVVAVAAVGLALFQPWKLWVDDTVDEAAPAGAVPITSPRPTTAPPAPTTAAAPTGPPSVTAPASAAPATSTAVPATTVATAAPTVPATPVGGAFIGIDHGTTGTAVLLQDATGAQFLRLEDLDTSNGPDLFVYLSTNPPDGTEGAFDDGYLNLGRLEGNVGNSNYPIPAGTDVARYVSVVIWCDRFNSAFGAAPLR